MPLDWRRPCFSSRVSPHPQHLREFSYQGFHRYSLRICTYQRRCIFVDQTVVALIRAQIERASLEQHVAVLAYCFMPDHVHLLVEGEDVESDCLKFVSRAKQYSGFLFSREFHGRLWQRYSYERVLRGEESTAVVARYILENPVRAGLVGRVEDYPFAGSFRYSLAQLMEWAYWDVKRQSG